MSQAISAKTSAMPDASIRVHPFQLGGPDHIWRRMVAFKEAEKRRDATRFLFQRDSIYFGQLSAFFDFMHHPKLGPPQSAAAFRAFWNALLMWDSYENCPRRWLTEAFIMAGADNEEIAMWMGRGESPVVVQAYRLIFFNVTPNLDNSIWMEQWIWGPARQRTRQLLTYDYIYKLIAVQCGLDVFKRFASRKIIGGPLMDEIYGIINSERSKESLNIVVAGAKLPLEHLIASADNTVAEWNSRAKDTNKNAGGATQADMERAQKAFDKACAILGSEEQLPGIERLDHVIKHE